VSKQRSDGPGRVRAKAEPKRSQSGARAELKGRIRRVRRPAASVNGSFHLQPLSALTRYSHIQSLDQADILGSLCSTAQSLIGVKSPGGRPTTGNQKCTAQPTCSVACLRVFVLPELLGMLGRNSSDLPTLSKKTPWNGQAAIANFSVMAAKSLACLCPGMIV
jgi:hypothetical protein